MKRIVQLTEDGSSTIYIEEMDENYHSSHGAVQEAKHVFLKYGLDAVNNNTVKIFEMGFGTGLNALLTIESINRSGKKIFYSAIEAFPVEKDLISELNYLDLVDGDLSLEFNKMHDSQWGENIDITDTFCLHKIHEKIEDYKVDIETVDLVYFDAFGPRAQSEMWKREVLDKMYSMLKTGGVLVTYCAMGQFKRDLKSLGFELESLPGPPGKREMTRAIKK